MQDRKGMKVVIDTNIWISFLFGKILSKLVPSLINNNIEIFTSNEQIDEIIKVITKPKISKHIAKSDFNRLIHFIKNKSNFVTIENNLNICRDPKDNFLLEIASMCDSDYLITGDKDLLSLSSFQNTRIITYQEFENMIII
jgi:uncharacterized protein